MVGFYEDIYNFLIDKGFEVTCRQCYGAETLHIGNRVILPVHITAGTHESAVTDSDIIFSITDRIRSTGSYPLIITEDRWRRQRKMMEARLLAHLEVFISVFARKCEVRRIDKATADIFLEANHSYGSAACRHRYGLFTKGTDDLIAVGTFSNARKWQKEEKVICSYEWTRYASVPEVRVIGGMGKLLNAFIKDVNPDDIMSYADLEWSEGKVYEQLGFVLERHKEPVLFEVDSAWRRFPVKQGMTEEAGKLYFRNLGSNKYRLKLTDYR